MHRYGRHRPTLEVGHGSSSATDPFEAGAGAAAAALSRIERHALSAIIVYTSSPYDGRGDDRSPNLIVDCPVGSNVSQVCAWALAAATANPQIRPFFDTSLAVRQRLTREGKAIFAMLFTPGNTWRHDSRRYELLAMKTKSLDPFPVVGGSAADDRRLETNAVLTPS